MAKTPCPYAHRGELEADIEAHGGLRGLERAEGINRKVIRRWLDELPVALDAPRRMSRAERADLGRRAAELRAEGFQWKDIAAELGFRDPAAAFVAAKRYGEAAYDVKQYRPRQTAAA